jgi:ankyrin repeat protein
VARLLLRAGADENAQDNIYGNTALHEAPDAATAKVLIEAGADINRRNQDGQTALMLTLDPEVTRVLLEAGADKAIRDKRGKTALEIAREFALTEKIAALER